MKPSLTFIIFLTLITKVELSHGQNNYQLINSFDAVQVSEKTLEDVNAAYKIIENAPIYLRTKKEKANNCENRAEFNFYVLEKLGFKPINFWIFKEGLIEPKYNTAKLVTGSNGLAFNTKVGRKPMVYWGYHVATGVIIQNNGKNDTLIFDSWTQGKITNLKDWSLSFFQEPNGRIIYVLPVIGLYKFYGTTAIGQLSTQKSDWSKNIDNDFNQMYCGLCGITPNKKCNKNRFKDDINNKKDALLKYLKDNGIDL
jgi:hypothetical protein